jgi:hypothetical protein
MPRERRRSQLAARCTRGRRRRGPQRTGTARAARVGGGLRLGRGLERRARIGSRPRGRAHVSRGGYLRPPRSRGRLRPSSSLLVALLGHLFVGAVRILSFVAHSGGSSSKTFFQITAAARVATSPERAPMAASRPDHIRRLINGLSFIRSDSTRWESHYPSRPPQIISTISVFTRSNSSADTGTPLKIHCVRTCSISP